MMTQGNRPRHEAQAAHPEADNRFERAWQRAKSRPFRSLLIALVLLVAADSLLAWAFVAKRALADLPYPDLLEKYYVLRPFRGSFPGQYGLPAGWWDERFLGDMGSPATVRAFWIADPQRGHRLRPNAIITENGWTYRATNPQGFVITDPSNPLYPRVKPPDVFRIIMLGGSTVEGDGASGSLTALPAVLLQTLQSGYAPTAGDRRFEVINAGVGGYDSAQELLYYLSDLSRYQADLVLLYDGWNDQQLRVLRHEPDAGRLATPTTRDQAAMLNDLFRWDRLTLMFLGRSATEIFEFLRRFALIDMPARVFAKPPCGAPPPARAPLTTT